MIIKESVPRKVFLIFDYIFLSFLAVLCIIPIIHMLALSFSSSTAINAGRVTFWPVEFSTEAYKYIMENGEFIRAFFVSWNRLLIAVPVNMVLTIMMAYPLSKGEKEFNARKYYVYIILFSMLFNGGLVPTYMIIKYTGIINTIWALVLPGAVTTYNIIVLHKFYKAIPKSIEESAFMDGAGHWRILWSLIVPLSKPAIATVMLFSIVNNWNAWFDGIIYMNSPTKYPLQSYLQTTIIGVANNVSAAASSEEIEKLMSLLGDRNLRSAKLFVALVPILIFYPFLQGYFTEGLVLGSVKE